MSQKCHRHRKSFIRETVWQEVTSISEYRATNLHCQPSSSYTNYLRNKHQSNSGSNISVIMIRKTTRSCWCIHAFYFLFWIMHTLKKQKGSSLSFIKVTGSCCSRILNCSEDCIFLFCASIKVSNKYLAEKVFKYTSISRISELAWWQVKKNSDR